MSAYLFDREVSAIMAIPSTITIITIIFPRYSIGDPTSTFILTLPIYSIMARMGSTRLTTSKDSGRYCMG